MDLTPETLQYLEDRLGTLESIELDGKNFFVGASQVIPCPHPVAPKMATALVLSTLSGFAKATVANIDGVELADCLIQVTPDRVKLLSMLDSHRQREVTLIAAYKSDWDDVTDRWIRLEEMVRLLGSRLSETAGADSLIKMISTSDYKKATITKKEGLSWRVSSSRSLSGEWTESDGLCQIAPFRAFPEIDDQVESAFVIEMRGDDETPTEARITNADGNAWRVEAADRVATHLQDALKAAVKDADDPDFELPILAW